MKTELIYQPTDKDLIEISLPLSKSILNRYQIISFLSDTDLFIDNEIFPQDNLILAEQLKIITKMSGSGCELNIGDSGTAMRFLIPIVCMEPGIWILDGSSRIRQRPVLHLVDELISMGGKIEYLSEKGFLPLKISSSKLKKKKVNLPGNISSQYISSLMLIAPSLEDGLEINISEDQVSMPYIKMTYGLMKQSGADIEWNENIISIRRSDYSKVIPEIERDWSAASYWYLITALLHGKKIKLKGLSLETFQGDSVCLSLFKYFGVKTLIDNDGIIIEQTERPIAKIDVDLRGFPDLAPSLIAASAAFDIPSVYRGLHHLKFKESDRLVVLKDELGKMGFNVESNEDTFFVHKRLDELQTVEINSHNDHRIAMALIPLSILIPALCIDNKECIRKSYPGFITDIENVGILIK